ncbi:hypothetical protein BDW71DRAFT_111656 [Aspergillus fruticulosus]
MIASIRTRRLALQCFILAGEQTRLIAWLTPPQGAEGVCLILILLIPFFAYEERCFVNIDSLDCIGVSIRL